MWFESGDESHWDAATLTYRDGKKRVKVSGVTAEQITLKFGDDGSDQYDTLCSIGAFADSSSEKIFEDEKHSGILANL